mgnify:FL=1
MKAVIFVLVFSMVVVGSLISYPFLLYPLPREEQLVNQILADAAKIIRDKYCLHPCGAGAAMPGGPVRGLLLSFDTQRPHTKEELRKLLIETAHVLLNQVTQNKEIQQFIYEKPFTIKNVQIMIFNRDKKKYEVCHPGISTAQIDSGELTYRTVDKANTFVFKNEYEESYEEALELLKKSNA